MLQNTRSAYARFDPTHLFDGLFVPTTGRKRGRLFVPSRTFGDFEISFQGFEQLGADDQSILLAISAQLGIEGLIIEHEPSGEISKELRLALELNKSRRDPVASRKTSLRSILLDAGYSDGGKDFETIKNSLNRLRSAQIREKNKAGWDRVSNLISTDFNHESGEIYVAANPKLTEAIFFGQHVRISLYERKELKTEVAKILHCWLSSNIRPGGKLGNGNGAHINTLAPHVWGQEWLTMSPSQKSTRRKRLRDSFDEIKKGTKKAQLGLGEGWSIMESNNRVFISRPRNMPLFDQIKDDFQKIATLHHP